MSQCLLTAPGWKIACLLFASCGAKESMGWGRRIFAVSIAFAAFCEPTSVVAADTELFSKIPIASQQETLEAPGRRPQSVFVFGGALTIDAMGESVNPFQANYEGDIFGIAYDRDFWSPGAGFVVSGELGLAGRFIDGSSAEVWGGVRVRRPIVIGDLWVTPALTVGLSGVTQSIPIEREREIQHGGDATLLFYFSPEISFRLAKYPQWELVYQLHHRSGLKGTLGNMHEGANANVLGLRYSF